MNFEFSLATNLINGRLIGQLGDELIRLNIDVLLAWGRLWRLHIAREKLLGRLGTLLLQPLRVVLTLVRLEQLVGIRAGRDDHGGVGAAAENALIVGDVLREIRILIDSAVWVLVLLLLAHDAGVGREALGSSLV